MYSFLFSKLSNEIHQIVIYSEQPLNTAEHQLIDSLFHPLHNTPNYNNYMMYGPKINFMSPWSTNVINIITGTLGHTSITQIEKYKLFQIQNNAVFDPLTESIYEINNIVFDSPNLNNTKTKHFIPINTLTEFSEKNNLGFLSNDIEYYTNLFRFKLKRDPTDIELYDLAESNSEHSRHHFFKGNLIYGRNHLRHSLFDMIKSTLYSTVPKLTSDPLLHYKKNKNIISTNAFRDNASAIRGYLSKRDDLDIIISNKYFTNLYDVDVTFTAETHNFPTGICPFAGAATGPGGRIRDTISIGRGGNTIAGTIGYCVGELDTQKCNTGKFATPLKILIDGSNGASDYGNKYGEPQICGFTRSFGINYTKFGSTLLNPDIQRIEWIKPILFTGGIGYVKSELVNKKEPKYGMVIVRLGGPAYKIGIGGGSSSSRIEISDSDFNAVQRGDPEMENKLCRVITSLTQLTECPIISIHDQGAGGMANVTKEIISPNGGKIFIDNVITGDKSMSVLETWISEHQEQCTILSYPIDLPIIKKICTRERLPFSVIGYVNNSTRVTLVDHRGTIYVDLPIKETLENVPKRTYYLIPQPKLHTLTNTLFENLEQQRKIWSSYNNELTSLNLLDSISKVFRDLSVGSKRFLTNKVDRSVTGLVAQQQCVGPFGVPISDYALVALSYHNKHGAVTAVGEQPIKGLLDVTNMVRLSIAEMLLNIVWVYQIRGLAGIRCSVNWMWPAHTIEGRSKLYEAMDALIRAFDYLQIAADGGKDSLSMSGNGIDSPPSVVVSGYSWVESVLHKVTPDFKRTKSIILLLKPEPYFRIGHTIYHKIFNGFTTHYHIPDVTISNLKCLFNVIQLLLKEKLILSGHDISDGGLITTVSEMCFAGGIGCDLIFNLILSPNEILFSEDPGVIIEVHPDNITEVNKILKQYPSVYSTIIGNTNNSSKLNICFNNIPLINISIKELWEIWESKSFEIELQQCNEICVQSEKNSLATRVKPYFYVPYTLPYTNLVSYDQKFLFNVAIIREEGCNSDKEMVAAFRSVGFNVFDFCMQDLIENPDLSEMNGIVFVGGFSYSDVLGAAEGWSTVINHNPKLYECFTTFKNRPNTFSLGVCNGCQLMLKLGWMGNNIKLEKNTSGRFESRFSTVKIEPNNSIFLANLADTVYGMWVAHGEGRFVYSTKSHRDLAQTSGLGNEHTIVMKYTDDLGVPTTVYPFCPNGSEYSIAALSSLDGRHLAIMPHPERSFIDWQIPWHPSGLTTPWRKIFENAYLWLLKVNM